LFQTDGTTKAVIKEDGKVGIGTISPGSVTGGTGAANLTIGTSNTAVTEGVGIGSLSFRTSDTSFTGTFPDGIGAEIAATGFGAVGAAYNLAFITSTTTGSNRGTRMLINAEGEVGIGTTSPGNNLTVAQPGTGVTATTEIFSGTVGDASTANISRVLFSTVGGGGGAGTATLSHLVSSSQFVLRAETAGGHEWYVGGSERARIDSSGRLLVGTSSSVFGSIVQAASTGGAQYEGARFSADAFGPAITLIKSRGASVGTNTAVQNGDVLGIIAFRGANGSDYSNVGAQIVASVDAEPFTSGDTTDLPTRLVFSVTADGASAPTEAMRINNAGELLVGYTTDNGAYKLQVNSQIFATSAIIATSDGRYKENVASLGGCLDLVKALRPVSFTWKPQEDITRIDDEGNEVLVREGHNFPDGTQVGFIAQEVQEVLTDKPWLSSVIKENVRPAVKDNDGNELAPEEQFYGIAEGNLIAVLTNALQEAVGRIEALEAEVAALKS
jgi:hypothetical protein